MFRWFLKWLKNPTIWEKSIVIDKPEREGRHVEHLYISTYIDRQCLRLSLHYHSRVSVESAGPCVMKKLLQKCMTHQYVIPYTFLYLYNTYYLSIYAQFTWAIWIIYFEQIDRKLPPKSSSGCHMSQLLFTIFHKNSFGCFNFSMLIT